MGGSDKSRLTCCVCGRLYGIIFLVFHKVVRRHCSGKSSELIIFWSGIFSSCFCKPKIFGPFFTELFKIFRDTVYYWHYDVNVIPCIHCVSEKKKHKTFDLHRWICITNRHIQTLVILSTRHLGDKEKQFLNLSLTLYMRWSAVIDVIVITRCHVGPILNANKKTGLKCGILKILI